MKVFSFALATGDIRPIATIGGAHTGLNDPVGIALDPGTTLVGKGLIYVVGHTIRQARVDRSGKPSKPSTRREVTEMHSSDQVSQIRSPLAGRAS